MAKANIDEIRINHGELPSTILLGKLMQDIGDSKQEPQSTLMKKIQQQIKKLKSIKNKPLATALAAGVITLTLLSYPIHNYFFSESEQKPKTKQEQTLVHEKSDLQKQLDEQTKKMNRLEDLLLKSEKQDKAQNQKIAQLKKTQRPEDMPPEQRQLHMTNLLKDYYSKFLQKYKTVLTPSLHKILEQKIQNPTAKLDNEFLEPIDQQKLAKAKKFITLFNKIYVQQGKDTSAQKGNVFKHPRSLGNIIYNGTKKFEICQSASNSYNGSTIFGKTIFTSDQIEEILNRKYLDSVLWINALNSINNGIQKLQNNNWNDKKDENGNYSFKESGNMSGSLNGLVDTLNFIYSGAPQLSGYSLKLNTFNDILDAICNLYSKVENLKRRKKNLAQQTSKAMRSPIVQIGGVLSGYGPIVSGLNIAFNGIKPKQFPKGWTLQQRKPCQVYFGSINNVFENSLKDGDSETIEDICVGIQGIYPDVAELYIAACNKQ